MVNADRLARRRSGRAGLLNISVSYTAGVNFCPTSVTIIEIFTVDSEQGGSCRLRTSVLGWVVETRASRGNIATSLASAHTVQYR